MRDARPAGEGAPKRAPGAQRGNANARTHGVYTLARRLKGAGPTKNDGRSVIERARRDWMNEIRAARGGDLSPQQEALLVAASATWVMLSTCDSYILDHGVVNRRRGTLRPIVEQRAKLARTLRELLSDIGLERMPAPRKNLGSHLQERYGGTGATKPQDERELGVDSEGATDA